MKNLLFYVILHCALKVVQLVMAGCVLSNMWSWFVVDKLTMLQANDWYPFVGIILCLFFLALVAFVFNAAHGTVTAKKI
jgi:ABC-type multidrug transport system fused ATPase/permease subunit